MSNKKELDVYPVFFDLMTGLMFIFMIALIAYMLSFNDKHSEENKLKSQLREITFLRSDIVNETSKQLKRFGVSHQAFTQDGVIRLTDERLQFDSGTWALNSMQESRAYQLEKALSMVVNCYAKSSNYTPAFGSRCRPDMSGKLESLIVEGHTDLIPMGSKNKIISDNMDLSYKRAKSFYDILNSENLGSMTNHEGAPLLVVAGFGSSRPLIADTRPESNNKNRRIDIRFQMSSNWIN